MIEESKDTEFAPYARLFRVPHKADLPDFDPAWVELAPNRVVNVVEFAPKGRSFRTVIMGSVAAAILIFIAAGVYFFRVRNAEPEGKPLRAIIVFTSGEVFREIEGRSIPASVGDILKKGETIKTKAGHADIGLSDNSAVRIGENTTLILERALDLTKGCSVVRMRLSSGRLLARLEKLTSSDSFEIQTPTAIASVRGTSFEVTADTKTTSVFVSEGSVQSASSTDSARSRILQPGDSLQISETSDQYRREPEKTAKLNAEFADMKLHLNDFSPEIRSVLDSLKSAGTEAELSKIYNQSIEIIDLKNGTSIRGVVVTQLNGKLIVQTIAGSYVVSETDIVKIVYVEE